MDKDFERPVDHAVVPDLIRIERDPLGFATVTIDGTKLPWALVEALSANIGWGKAPAVTLTFMAKRVEVVDAYLEGVELAGHDHTEKSEPVVIVEPPKVEIDEDAEHEKLRAEIIADLVAGRNPRAAK